MSEKDLVIGPQLRVPDGSVISAKPSYLITLTEKTGNSKSMQFKKFISLDLPNTTHPHFVQAKGFFCDQDEEAIIANYKQIVATIDKEKVIEIYFSASSVFSIRSLVFKAK